VLAEEVEVHEAVGIRLENDAAGIASLRDVVRRAESDDASKTGHDNKRVWKRCESSQENVPSVPGFFNRVLHRSANERQIRLGL